MNDLLHCKVCKFMKPASDFYCGVMSRCKACHKAAVAANRNANIERVRAYDRERALLPHRAENNRRVCVDWRAANPDRYRANNVVNNAIRDGRLERLPCWVCGEKAVAHHPNYSSPLDVVWLCQAHHKQAHALAKDAA